MFNPVVVVVDIGHHFPGEGSNNRFYAHRSMLFPPSSRHPGQLVDWWTPPFNQQVPSSTGAVHKSVTFRCVFMLVKFNKCVVACGSDLQRGHSSDGCLSSSILLKYECSIGHMFVMSWARVRRAAGGSSVSE